MATARKQFTCMSCGHVGAAGKNKAWKAKCCENCGSFKIEEGAKEISSTGKGVRYGVCGCGSSSFKLAYENRQLFRTCNKCGDKIDPTKINLSGGTQ